MTSVAAKPVNQVTNKKESTSKKNAALEITDADGIWYGTAASIMVDPDTGTTKINLCTCNKWIS